MTDKEILMTQELLDAARADGACVDGLKDASAFVGCPLVEWANKNLEDALWFIKGKLCQGEVLAAVSSVMGVTVHKDEDGELHCEDGPALCFHDGHEEWHCHGEIHRDDGPAIVRPNGTKEWISHGKFHREDGPAIIFAHGAGLWFKNGHRIDPPNK